MDYLSIAMGVTDETQEQPADQEASPCAMAPTSTLGGCVKSVLSVKSPSQDAAALHNQLAVLYADIREGCQMGFHRHLHRVPADIVRAIIAAVATDAEPVAFDEAYRRAGNAALLAAVIDEYRYQLRLLSGLDPQAVLKYAAELELCLLLEPEAPHAY